MPLPTPLLFYSLAIANRFSLVLLSLPGVLLKMSSSAPSSGDL
uniref:Uncharacterized protein n=1 Tax=Arundo donax TaxID=35708 RepID=A0A0A8YW70_ARUDO